MSLTKADMAEMLFEELGLNKREAKGARPELMAGSFTAPASSSDNDFISRAGSGWRVVAIKQPSVSSSSSRARCSTPGAAKGSS